MSTRGPLPGAVQAAALLPLRFFLGLTFLYAGADKLLDPGFFDPSDPASIMSQLAAFARSSPLSVLITLSEPYATPIGLLIAIGEIGVGLGALTGIAFRVASVGGALLSLMFWLSASWATHPYYYGPDLPYAAGWLTMALAGHGGLFVWRRLLPGERAVPHARPPSSVEGTVASPGRRALLEVMLLGGLALVIASLAVPLRLLGREALDDRTGSPSPTPVEATPSPPNAGLRIAEVAQVEKGGAASFTVPFDAPSPLPAGDPGIIVKTRDGTLVAFDAICTHAACTVEWDAVDGILVCPCHGATFDAEDQGRVLTGPAIVPLVSLPIVVDAASGTIYLRA
jgi:thiosulfate dehydrogenase [quinone] large subunit